MILRRTAFAASIVLFFFGIESNAQDGFVSGGFETNSIWYLEDPTTGAQRPDGGIGSNNYLKVDFGRGSLEGGLQLEGYFPALLGYSNRLNGLSLSNKYIRYRHDGLCAEVGDFYEQLGSGLLFRAWEERSLGINTALEGAHVTWSLGNLLGVKAFSGAPHSYMEYNWQSLISGVDLSLDIASLLGVDIVGILLEGSFLNKHQALENAAQAASGMTPDVNGISARASFELGGFSLKGEWVGRDADVTPFNLYNNSKSRALLVEAAYSYGALGANVSFRKISNMGFQSNYHETQMYTFVNYVPSLTHQHTYTLAALTPYQTQIAGEIGGQADFYYFFPRKSLIGGVKGMKTHLNFSTYYGPRELPELTAQFGNELYYRDFTFDAERWWGRKLKTIFLYTYQFFNNRVGTHPSNELRTSHTIVADATFKIDSNRSIRGEYQHLWTAFDRGNWMSATVEYSVSPTWSFVLGDTWNYGYSGIHYYNASASWSHSNTRVALSFGRFMEGYQCAGGVCRMIPAYTGANLSLYTTF